MAKEFSLEEIFPTAKPPSTLDNIKSTFGVTTKPAEGLSVADVYGPDKLDVEAKEFYSAGGQVKQAAKDVGGKLLSLGVATGDMIIGAPAALAGKVLNVGTRLRAMAGGESQRVQGQAGLEAEVIVPEALKQPLQSLMQYYTGQKPWDQSIVEKTLESIGHGVEKASGQMLTKEDTMFLLGTLMDTMGVKGLQLGMKAISAKVVEGKYPSRPITVEDVREFEATKQAEGVIAAGRGKARAAPREPHLESIPDPVVVESPAQVRQIFKDAKSNRVTAAKLAERGDVQWVKDLFEQAKQPRQAPPPIGAIGAEAGTVPKTRLVEGQVLGETPPTPLPETLVTAMQKVSSGQKFLLSAEERIALQGLAQESRIVNAEGRPIHSKQGGAADVKMLVALGLLSGAALTVMNDPGIMAAIRSYADRVRRTFEPAPKAPSDNPFGIPPDDTPEEEEYWRRHQERIDREQKFKRDPEEREPGGKFWAGAEELAPLGLLAGAVKGKGGNWHPEAVGRLAKPLKDVLNTNLYRLIDQEARQAQDLLAARNEKALDEANIRVSKHYDQITAHEQWSERAVQNYLNKHAGTATDPLKDVEIPFGDGMRRWEEVTDAYFSSHPASSSFYKGRIGKGDEPVWAGKDIHAWDARDAQDARDARNAWDAWNAQDARDARNAWDALQSYLSHAGDFARQNIPPEKLGQYDLVRLIKETAEHDAKLARQAAKDLTKVDPVRKANSDALPEHKAYPEIELPDRFVEFNKSGSKQQTQRLKLPPERVSFSWREIAEPKELTEAQARTVRLAEGKEYYTDKQGDRFLDYTALDSQGKPIINNFTGEPATGPTPQKAWHAGRLAEEGNVLGHCVGGYCDAVWSGESRIFSLRDSKGRSYATVEVAPPDVRVPTNSPEHFARVMGGQWLEELNKVIAQKHSYNAGPDFNRKVIASPEYQAWIKRQPNSILQIKGPGNRAPAPEVLPYVQDFVRSGKWGDVRDLENAGLVRGKDVFKFDDFRQAAEQAGIKFNPEHFYTKTEIDQIINKDNRNRDQRGSVDPKLLTGLAATVGGAAIGAGLDTDNPLRGGMLGAAGGLIASRMSRSKDSVIHQLDKDLGRSSTRLGNIDPQLRLQAREVDRKILRKMEENYTQAEPFFIAADKLSKEKYAALERAYLRNDPHEIAEAIKGNPELVAGYRKLRNLLDSFETRLKDVGRFKEGLTEYLPRIVKDYPGLKEAMGQEARTKMEKTMAKAEADMIRTRGRGLTEVEQSLIVNRILLADEATSSLPGFARRRSVEMSDKLQPFYYGMKDSALRYISEATKDLEIASFFGKDLAVTKKGEQKYTNIDDSIGNLIARKMKEGRMTPEQAVEVREILRARFGPGEQTPFWALQDIRNVNNMALLGQFDSAATQIGDTFHPVYHHGLKPTLEATALKLVGRGISPKEFGLANHIAEELSGGRLTGKALAMNFKLNLFSAVDQWGKGTNITAGFLKNQRLAQTPSGVEKLRRKWGEAYGDEFPQLVKDLRQSTREKRTDLVDSLLWNELADAQPISKIEMSQSFNEHPNGRLLFQMKTYMQTQADVFRRDAYNEIKKGDPKSVATGLKNLTAFSAVLSMANIPADVIKDWISGRPFDFDKVDYVENLLKNFGLNRYATDKIQKGQALEVARDMIVPPFKHYQDIAGMDRKTIKYLPPAGRAYYDRELGGNEERKLREAREKRLDDRNKREREFPYLREQRLRREAARKQRQLDRARSLP